MVDMLTILTVFLLQTFSASGELVQVNKNIVLPQAQNFTQLEQAPNISISHDAVALDGRMVADASQLNTDNTTDWKINDLHDQLVMLKNNYKLIHPTTPFTRHCDRASRQKRRLQDRQEGHVHVGARGLRQRELRDSASRQAAVIFLPTHFRRQPDAKLVVAVAHGQHIFSSCQEDPNDPKTWIKKLNKPDEQKTAIRELVKLKDPQAVPPLIELYDKTNKDPDVLKAIATFKDKAALKTMIDSLDYADGKNCDNAATAANAIGDMYQNRNEEKTELASAVEPLVGALLKPLPVATRCNVVKLEAMKSLGKIHDPKAIDALTKVLQTPADEQDFFLNLVAADTLGEIGDPRAVPALIRGLFMTGRHADAFQNSRVALLNIGKPAIPALIKAMQGSDPELNADAKKYQFRPGVIVMKTSKVLGDARAPEATVPLLDQLKKPAEGDAYGGVLRALGKIGDPSATKEIVRILTDPKQAYLDRAAARPKR